MRFVLVVLAVAALCASAAASDLVPTISNPGFEDGVANWVWQPYGPVQASWEISDTNPHSGKNCMLFKSSTPATPNVFGRLHTNVNVLPSTEYELSCWVRGEDVGKGPGASHITDWGVYMLPLPTGTFGWQKVTTKFTTGAGQQVINIGINVTDTCKALVVDDLSFRPLGGQLKGEGISGIILTGTKAIGHDTPVPSCVLVSSSNRDAAEVETIVSIHGKTVFSERNDLKLGENKIDWEWNTGDSPFGIYACLVRVLDSHGVLLASGTATTEVVDSPMFADLAKVEARKAEFDALYAQCKAKGIRLDYPTAAKTMLEQFIPYAKADIRRAFDYRANWGISDFNKCIDDSITEMRAYLADPDLAPIMKRYKTGKVDIDGLSFIGDRVDSLGNTDRGPLFFCGYGHFYQARLDMPRWPGYGINIIQSAEFGPAQLFPKEGVVDLTLAKTLVKTLDAAAKNNVRVDWLLSPHYFPAWAMAKYPQLGKGGGGFLGFCVDDPAAKQIVEKFLRIVVPMIKDKPALHSICLSNEPINPFNGNCPDTKPLWIEYLKQTHGDIATLNKRYGTEYASFGDVPYGGDPQAYDWMIYNHQRFTAWHRWMADIIHEMAPNVPTHAKAMSNALNASQVGWATNQEMLGNALELNGNDCYMFPANGVVDPWLQNTSYDIQRSFARKPVFNSENHIAPDGSNYYMQPGAFRTALWQGAVHGQGCTTIWVWERAFDNSNGFIGSVMDRPLCAQAVGTTCLDLNRFADEVTALETMKAPVAIVYSMSSIIRRGNEHTGAIYGTYFCLDFSGLKIDFISEKQLAEGKGADYKAIIVPDAETMTDAAFEGLRKLPASTKLFTENNCFVRNEYGKARDPKLVKELNDKATALAAGAADKVLWPSLRGELGKAGVLPEYSVVDAKTGEVLWNVEWLPVNYKGKTLINIVNYLNKPVDVKIMRGGKEVEATDMFSIGGREKVGTLRPIMPVLAEVK